MLAVPLLHPVNTDFIEWFEDIEGSEEEGTRTTSGIKDGDLTQLGIEMLHKQVVIRLSQQVLHKLADIEIVGDEVVNLCNLAILDFRLDTFVAL